jgi:hypothetical protein
LQRTMRTLCAHHSTHHVRGASRRRTGVMQSRCPRMALSSRSFNPQCAHSVGASCPEGLFFSRNTPDVIVRQLHDATINAMNTPALRDRIQAIGTDLVTLIARVPTTSSNSSAAKFSSGQRRSRRAVRVGRLTGGTSNKWGVCTVGASFCSVLFSERCAVVARWNFR